MLYICIVLKMKIMKILDVDELGKLLIDKVAEKKSDLGLGISETLKKLGISHTVYYDLKKYITTKEIRHDMNMPIGIPALKKIASSVGVKYVETMHCVKL